MRRTNRDNDGRRVAAFVHQRDKETWRALRQQQAVLKSQVSAIIRGHRLRGKTVDPCDALWQNLPALRRLFLIHEVRDGYASILRRARQNDPDVCQALAEEPVDATWFVWGDV